MSDDPVRLADYAAHVAKTAKVFSVEGDPWTCEGRILRPLAMPHRRRAVSRPAVRKIMRQAGAVLAQWTEGWDTPPCGWWYVCCDQRDYDLSKLKGNVRYVTRRGLDRCEVRHVDPQWFAENGYPVYAAAFGHYGTKPLLTEAEFVQEFRQHAEYPGRETWGAFIGNKLVAWASVLVIDDAVQGSSAKADPAYFKSNPNNALFFVLTRHYLRDRQLAYVSAGARVLLHKTKVQDFHEKLGYRKVFCLLRAERSPFASFVTSLGLPRLGHRLGLERVLGSSLGKLDALDSVVSISCACLDLPATAAEPRDERRMPLPDPER